ERAAALLAFRDPGELDAAKAEPCRHGSGPVEAGRRIKRQDAANAKSLRCAVEEQGRHSRLPACATEPPNGWEGEAMERNAADVPSIDDQGTRVGPAAGPRMGTMNRRDLL